MEQLPDSEIRCPRCGTVKRPGEAAGLCPACLLAEAGRPTGSATVASEPAVAEGAPGLEEVASAFPSLEVLGLLGRGGMGAVYKVRQRGLERLAALKILPGSLAARPGFRERFAREARALARLQHSHIVGVYDYGESGGFCYLLLEYVDGVNLRQAMRAGGCAPAQALTVVPQICAALHYAHGEGVLHRDIKPENILLDRRGNVKIADFGIAKLAGDHPGSGTGLTATEMRLGTPHYMAPEQMERPGEVDHRADIYSLGVVFYEMLTGELPFGRFVPPSEKSPVDPRLDEVVLRALAREREKRQQSAEEVGTEVSEIAATAATQADPAGPGKAEGAAAGESPAGPPPTTCYVATPQHLRGFVGRYLYTQQGKGTLRLDGRTLVFERGWHRVTIPLAAIRELGTGHFPATAKPFPLRFLAVTFEEGGGTRTLLFTPRASAASLAWKTNDLVDQWREALGRAVEVQTGRRPADGGEAVLGTARPKPWHRWAMMGLLVVLLPASGALWSLVREGALPSGWRGWFPLLAPAVGMVLAFFAVTVWAGRQERPSGAPERTRGLGWWWVLVAVAGLALALPAGCVAVYLASRGERPPEGRVWSSGVTQEGDRVLFDYSAQLPSGYHLVAVERDISGGRQTTRREVLGLSGRWSIDGAERGWAGEPVRLQSWLETGTWRGLPAGGKLGVFTLNIVNREGRVVQLHLELAPDPPDPPEPE